MDIVKLNKIVAVKADTKLKLKGKEFKNIPTKDKDLLLETMAKMLGLID